MGFAHPIGYGRFDGSLLLWSKFAVGSPGLELLAIDSTVGAADHRSHHCAVAPIVEYGEGEALRPAHIVESIVSDEAKVPLGGLQLLFKALQALFGRSDSQFDFQALPYVLIEERFEVAPACALGQFIPDSLGTRMGFGKSKDKRPKNQHRERKD